MCQTRVHPTPKVKFPLSMILLGLNVPHQIQHNSQPVRIIVLVKPKFCLGEHEIQSDLWLSPKLILPW